jgi:DNA repair exonuclease SbcCD ATPase subunit
MSYENPYIKVTWQDTPENFTPEKISRVKSYFQKKYNSKHVQIITKVASADTNTKLRSLDISENISDGEYQKNLMKDFVKENSIDVDWTKLDRLDNKVNEILITNGDGTIKYNKWYVKKIEFSNFLSYGKDNVIDFTELPGITVVESTPKNFGGKSTATVDLMMFLFFNKTTKTKTNSEIFNRFTEENEVFVKGYVTIDGDDYVIERSLRRTKSSVTTKLEIYKLSPDGTVENLNGEQRRETEKFITAAIGSEEDFLSTILTTGYNLEELVESKPTARGQILTRFLGLETLKKKEEICKNIQTEWSRKLVSTQYNIVDLQTEIETYTEQITQSEEDIKTNETNLVLTEGNLKTLEVRRDEALSKRNTDIDQELIKTNPDQIKRDINDLTTQKQTLLNNSKSVDVKEPTQFYLEEAHEEVKSNLSNVVLSKRLLDEDIKRRETIIGQLEKGSICPTCNRALDQVDHTDEINKLKSELEGIVKSREEILTNLSEITERELSYSNLKKEYDEYERNKLKKAKFELEAEQKQNEIDKYQIKIDTYDRNKSKLEENQRIDGELIGIRTQIETSNANIRTYTTSIERLKNSIVTLKEKIETAKGLIQKINVENDTQTIFKIYLTIYGKNGISKVVLRNMVPLINQELYRLLVDSCYFILEMNINEKNEVEFNMIDTETRVVKPLNSGSGYERTIASLAIRSVLTKISSLPKPNIVVMDEVFGKIADENLEMVGEFFKKIKSYFDHIFVISHNTLIRNWSDNLVMVKKDDNVSSIDFINPKISQ